ncbi:DUF4274 domain-containing protein [Sporosarcina sp. Marseille-Q4063]|uniref:DUF4274 domain-containing protein n=1 Tax=Sporosarcina sp. Marseille-Q4063 TaxID=2810514 RepID=UPI001BAFFFC8|nr:DUF4274 domain-containing protein [Sporosarcina sp. Marseille-Q4063]QUW23030.1 DUF4274 domain-containing protein [Sporosarcina sp. Marseille-Q4063]
MDKKAIRILEELLYQAEKDDVIRELSTIDNPLILHFFAANYNWNNGFDIPNALLENEKCDLGTGLLLFHDADGYRMLETPEEVLASSLEEWKDFLCNLYNRLKNAEFTSRSISYNPELTKIQKFKLKKGNPKTPDILMDQSPGEAVDIPKI